ncbi:cation:proton antiporter [Polluticaenibacter yanchengensis]|uniref:Cation:proton antiporter n=1 Tax=Polluticaenibacter yanchengensis TaxID=3014562 RepID=A0ABT4UJ37_9BACT|nr:cation:proton antiporter [Chitinophagaceae bacterium LY-5]
MKKFKNSIFYIVTAVVFLCLMYFIAQKGVTLEGGRHIRQNVSTNGNWSDFMDAMKHNLEHPLAILLAQVITIILVARFFGFLFKKIGQPSVIGEIIAGIALGPSLLGAYFPEFSQSLFPAQSLGNLQFLSQFGLILFMFVIGMELDLKVLQTKAKDAVVISHASILFPFALGMGLTYFIYDQFAPEGVNFLSFSLFMGIAMSITAFPVLARIVQERNIHKTKLGTIAITCAAADDITAWCILAAVIAIVKAGSFVSALYVIALAVLYVLVMIKLVRPFLKRIGDLHSQKDSLSKVIVAIFFLTLLISSYATEIIGIHALFGAFMAGAIMPENAKFRHLFIEKVEDVALVLLLPLFFVFTGLRTEIGLLNDPQLWKLTGVIILVAVVGKFLGSAIAAKYVGQNWKDSLTLGALMNTRGLMELVVLNIGYDLGVLTPEVFAMMVIMALVTTFMTGPALDIINKIFKTKEKNEEERIKNCSKYNVLFSFGSAETGKGLMKLANAFTRKLNGNASLTAMHFSSADDQIHYDIDQYEKDAFKPVLEESAALNREVSTVFKATQDIELDITGIANKNGYDLLLIGLGQSIYHGTLLGKLLGFTTRIMDPELLLGTFTGKENIFENSPIDDRTQEIIAKSEIPVGIFVNKDFDNANSVFVPIFSEHDHFLINYAQKLIHNSQSQVIVLDATGQLKNDATTIGLIRSIEQKAPNQMMLQSQRTIDKDLLKLQSLMLISLESWKKLVETKSVWLSDIPSTLIINDNQLA